MVRVECIEFKRCCFCIPLRYGLLISGYIKLITTLPVLLSAALELKYYVGWAIRNPDMISRYISIFTFFGILIPVCLADVALTIVFLVGAHKKEAKLLKVYNYYSMGVFVLFILAFIIFHGVHMYGMVSDYGFLLTLSLLKISLVSGLVNIGFQLYLILLTKSEINKLENNCKFRFVNNANEAECTLDEGENEYTKTYYKNNEMIYQCKTVNDA